MRNRDTIAQKVRGKEIVHYNVSQFLELAPDLEQCLTKTPKFETRFNTGITERYEHTTDRSLKLVPGAAVFLCHEETGSLISEKNANEPVFLMHYQHQCNTYNLTYKNTNFRNKLSFTAINPGYSELTSIEQGVNKILKIAMTAQGLENLLQLSGIETHVFDDLRAQLAAEGYVFKQFDIPLTFKTKFEELMKLLVLETTPNILALSANIFSLSTDMLELVVKNGFESVISHSKKQSNLAQSAKTFVDDYANMVTNAQQLAEMLNTSVSTLQRQFKLAYNISIGQYIKDQRLITAAEFLEQDMTIEEVSELLGYSYRSAFERAFKNHYGYSPGNHNKQKSK